MEMLSQSAMMLAELAPPPSLPPVLKALPTDLFLHPTPAFLALLLCSNVIWFFGLWIASKIFIEPCVATFFNAVKVWSLNVATFAGGIIGIAVGVQWIASTPDAWRLLLIVGGGWLLMLLMVFLIPMKVYGIGFPRAFLVVASVLVVQVAIVMGLELTVFRNALPGGVFAGLPKIDGIPKLVEQTWGEASPDHKTQMDFAATQDVDQLLNTALHPTGPKPTLEEREALAQVLQQKLQARRDTLAVDDIHEVAVYQNQLNRYMSFLQVVAAERLKHPAPTQTARLGAPAPGFSTH